MLTNRAYSLLGGDFPRVRAFLDENCGQYGEKSRGPEYWEYAHSHPAFDYASNWRNRLWEEDGKLVAVAWYEMELGKAYLTCDGAHEFLLGEMLDYAEKWLSRDGKLQVEVSSCQPERMAWLESRGYRLDWAEDENQYDLAETVVPAPQLPEGFTVRRVSELATDEWQKLITAIHQGFDHEDEGDINSVGLIQAAPSVRPELARVAVAPNGDYAAYAGVWFNGGSGYAYLEPLCTHPRYHRLGLAKALLYTILAEMQGMGARYMTGGDNPFYQAIGYRTRFKHLTYQKKDLK